MVDNEDDVDCKICGKKHIGAIGSRASACRKEVMELWITGTKLVCLFEVRGRCNVTPLFKT